MIQELPGVEKLGTNADVLAKMASEVIRVMNDERLGPDCVDLATSIVVSKSKEGFGEARQIAEMAKQFLSENPELLTHLKGNARKPVQGPTQKPVNSMDAEAIWERENNK